MNLSDVPGIGPKTLPKLYKKEIASTEDLIWYLPISYQKYEEQYFEDKQKLKIQGVIATKITNFRTKTNKIITNFSVVCNGNFLNVIAFNNKFLDKQIAKGDHVQILGTWSESRQQITLTKAIKIANSWEEDQGATIIPIYSKITGVTNSNICKYALSALKYSKLDTALKTALENVHSPTSFEDLNNALESLKYFEFEQYYLKMKNAQTLEANPNFCKKVNRELVAELTELLPFKLTNDQKEVIEKCCQTFERDQLANAIICGDVGSGKTIVAIMLIAALWKTEFQMAIMAPTEVLANQIMQVAITLLPAEDVGYLVGSTSKREKDKLKKALVTNKLKLVIGTHALIYDDVIFHKLGLVIIDEQHRFGVEQRRDLVKKGEMVEYVSLSATPIPRTLAKGLYQGCDILQIAQKPLERKIIETMIVNKNSSKKIYAEIERTIANNEQVFVVAPMIEEGEIDNVASVELMYERLCKYYPNYKIGLLHGSLKAREKMQVLTDFAQKKIQILVSTTVIEVGIDIPNATLMVIVNAERFGLAQLHQLRGRVGRSNLVSKCILYNCSEHEKSTTRLNMLIKYHDGVLLAQEDLKLRGPGDFFGVRQSGNPDFKVFDPQADMHIADKVIEKFEKGAI